MFDKNIRSYLTNIRPGLKEFRSSLLEKREQARAPSEGNAAVHPPALLRTPYRGTDRRRRVHQQKRMSAVFPGRTVHLPASVCKQLSSERSSRFPSHHGLADQRDRCRMRIYRNELFLRKVQKAIWMHAVGISAVRRNPMQAKWFPIVQTDQRCNPHPELNPPQAKSMISHKRQKARPFWPRQCHRRNHFR